MYLVRELKAYCRRIIVKTNYQLIDQRITCTVDLSKIEQMFEFSHVEHEIYLFVPPICNIDIYKSIHFFIHKLNYQNTLRNI